MTSIRSAVSYLGTNTMRNLVLSAEVFSAWQKVGKMETISIEQLHEHALKTASACQALCAGSPLADDAWLAGLLHDIGYLILLKERPQEYSRVLQMIKDDSLDSSGAEQQVFGTTHAEIGAYLLGLWGLPYALVEAVAMHHTPMAVSPRSFDLLAVLATAQSLLPISESEKNVLPMSSEWTPVITEQEFMSFNPPFNWQEAAQRVQTACMSAS